MNMNVNIYKIECLTNLHVGSGDLNFNIVDNEVEKDPSTGYPMIHSSGVKGALRDYFENIDPKSALNINAVFGKQSNKDTDSRAETTGTLKFMDAHILARPMRIWNSGNTASLPVTSIAMINQFLDLTEALGHKIADRIDNLDFEDYSFLCTTSADVEGEEKTKTISLDDCKYSKLNFLKNYIGSDFAIAKHINEYDLPVLARNCLDGDGNLWYEEVVPHGSVFYFIVLTPKDKANEADYQLKLDGEIVQFGAHSSIGRGFCKVTDITPNK